MGCFLFTMSDGGKSSPVLSKLSEAWSRVRNVVYAQEWPQSSTAGGCRGEAKMPGEPGLVLALFSHLYRELGPFVATSSLRIVL